MVYKVKKLTVEGEQAYYVGKGSKYFPKLKFPSAIEAEEKALIMNLHAHYDKAKAYFEKLEKLMPEKYDENKDWESDKTNFADLLC